MFGFTGSIELGPEEEDSEGTARYHKDLGLAEYYWDPDGALGAAGYHGNAV